MFPQATSFLVHKVVLWLGSRRIFFLAEVLLFCEHTDSPIVGTSDVSQVSTYPFSRCKRIIWPLIRSLEGNMSYVCSHDL